MAQRPTDFDDLKQWLQGVDPENRGVQQTMEVVARIVLTSHDDPRVVLQAQQIVGGR